MLKIIYHNCKTNRTYEVRQNPDADNFWCIYVFAKGKWERWRSINNWNFPDQLAATLHMEKMANERRFGAMTYLGEQRS